MGTKQAVTSERDWSEVWSRRGYDSRWSGYAASCFEIAALWRSAEFAAKLADESAEIAANLERNRAFFGVVVAERQRADIARRKAERYASSALRAERRLAAAEAT